MTGAMHDALVPCPRCLRHVRASERRCPFCAVALPAEPRPRALPEGAGRLSRSALAALALAACSGTTTPATPPPPGPGPTSGGAAAPPARDAGSVTSQPPVDASAGADAADDPAPPVAEYGAPMPPGEYGTAPRDAGALPDVIRRWPRQPSYDEGSVQPLYGVSPKPE